MKCNEKILEGYALFDLRVPLILASGSPRRKEILDLMGLPYTVDVSDADESFSGGPKEMVMELSKRKALAVAQRHPHSIILAADTLVFADSVLGKPQNEEDACRMLEQLSGQWHSVYTGVTLIHSGTGKIIQNADQTKVHFTTLSAQDIKDYVEPMDKAGAYGVQGMGGMFIDRIEGSYSNVVGLPMAMLREMLGEINTISF